MNQNIFNIICEKCGGGCCHGYEIFLIEPEVKKIIKSGLQFKYKKEGSGFLTVLGKRFDCFFLKAGLGCILKKDQKPFDCDLFPLSFIYKQGKFKFYLLKECPYYKKISQTKIKQMKKIALVKLKKWNEAEIKTYSRLIAARQKSGLLAV
ncbi:MAG: hypothetical protein Q8O59_03780 [bacterium]|nr:hypothetical protein [bacterium]